MKKSWLILILFGYRALWALDPALQARIESSLGAQASGIITRLNHAEREGLAMEPLYNKIHEGLAKKAPAERIEQALQHRIETLRTIQAASDLPLSTVAVKVRLLEHEARPQPAAVAGDVKDGSSAPPAAHRGPASSVVTRPHPASPERMGGGARPQAGVAAVPRRSIAELPPAAAGKSGDALEDQAVKKIEKAQSRLEKNEAKLDKAEDKLQKKADKQDARALKALEKSERKLEKK